MPAYNASAFIAGAIGSVINQTFTNWELIVINDGSSDETENVVKSFVDARIKLINQVNKGLGAARNNGIEAATGNWIAFLDSDDIWLPNKLQLQYQFIGNSPDVDVFYSNGYMLSADAPIRLPYNLPVAIGKFSGDDMYVKQFIGNHIPVLSACVKQSWCKKVGKQKEELIGSEDWDYWLRLAKQGAVFYGIAERLFVYRIHSGSMSGKVLTQRLSSIIVLSSNFDAQLLSADIIKNFKLSFIRLYYDLKKDKRYDDAGKLETIYENLFSCPIPATKINRIGRGTLLMERLPGMKNFVLKAALKSIVLKCAGLILFRPRRKMLKHIHNFAIQYHRWLLGKQLQIKGLFFMSHKATITAAAQNAQFITYGLDLKEYSRINLNSDDSYIFTGTGVVINCFCNINVWHGRLLLGNNVLFNNYCSVNCMEEITIGDNTWFGEGVRLYDHNHRYRDTNLPFTSQGMSTGKIQIGSNCWIGSNTIILQNVTIGDNCVIGANNLIHRSIPPGTVVKAAAMANLTPIS